MGPTLQLGAEGKGQGTAPSGPSSPKRPAEGLTWGLNAGPCGELGCVLGSAGLPVRVQAWPLLRGPERPRPEQ